MQAITENREVVTNILSGVDAGFSAARLALQGILQAIIHFVDNPPETNLLLTPPNRPLSQQRGIYKLFLRKRGVSMSLRTWLETFPGTHLPGPLIPLKGL